MGLGQSGLLSHGLLPVSGRQHVHPLPLSLHSGAVHRHLPPHEGQVHLHHIQAGLPSFSIWVAWRQFYHWAVQNIPSLTITNMQPGNPDCRRQGEEDHSGVLDIRRALHLAVVPADDDRVGFEPHLDLDTEQMRATRGAWD